MGIDVGRLDIDLATDRSAAPGWFRRQWMRLEDSRLALLPVTLTVMAVLIGTMAWHTTSSGKQDVDNYSAMLAVELLEVSGTYDVKISAPNYPLLIATVARLDPAVQAAVTCHAIKRPCGPEASFATLIAIQYAAALITLVAIFCLAYRVSGNWEIAVLALVLTFAGSRLGAHTASASPTIWLTAFSYVGLAFAVEAHARKSIACAIGAGVFAGALAAFYPLATFFGLALAAALALSLARKSVARGLITGFALLLGALTVGIAVYLAMPSYGGAAAGRALLLQLSERVGHQPTDLSSWVASLVLPIPFFGGWLEFLFADNPARYVTRSYELMEAAQHSVLWSVPAQYEWLLRTHVLGGFGSYVAATPVLLNRGLWGGADLVAPVGIFHVRRLFNYASADDRLSGVLIVLAPAAALLCVNTLLSANPGWSNPAMPFVWAFAIAYVVGRFPTPGAKQSENTRAITGAG
jgi:hypothetical protein